MAAVRATPIENELYSAEAFYCVTAGVRDGLKLLFRYFGGILNIFSRIQDE